MDQHPIPQDVTGFQFKLIGSMTVKQFGYVAVGVVSAVILYYLPLNSFWGVIAKVFLIPLFGASGVVIAFVPIEGRPIDLMATNFAKALFSPNQYIYRKVGRKFSFSAISYAKVQQPETATPDKKVISQKQKLADKREEQLQALLLSSQGRVKNDLDKKEMAFLHTFAPPKPTPMVAPTANTVKVMPLTPAKPHVAVPAPLVTPQVPQQPMVTPTQSQVAAMTPTPSPLKPEDANTLVKKEAELAQQLQTAKQEEATQPPTNQPIAHQKVVTLEKQMEDVHRQKQHLEEELARLKAQLAGQQQPLTQMQTTPATQPTPQYVRNIPQGMNKTAGLPHVSDTPNVVVGIVKDSRGNVLPNMLVEVKDKDANPVRAFKTNPLGQFASATPLAPGTYTIELEDPKKQHSFDIIQITANNQILLPIEIISHDAREALRQQLFN